MPEELSPRDWVPVSGDSMRPFLRAGDLVRLEPLAGKARSGADVPAGAVVLARGVERDWVLHRVVSADGRLRGDSALAWDIRATPLARVVAVASVEDGRPRDFAPSALDRLAAWLSARALPAESRWRGIFRKGTQVLGWIRRKSLGL